MSPHPVYVVLRIQPRVGLLTCQANTALSYIPRDLTRCRFSCSKTWVGSEVVHHSPPPKLFVFDPRPHFVAQAGLKHTILPHFCLMSARITDNHLHAWLESCLTNLQLPQIPLQWVDHTGGRHKTGFLHHRPCPTLRFPEVGTEDSFLVSPRAWESAR